MVFDSSLRTISNLIVDQTLGNPAAILKGLELGGVVRGQPGQRRAGAGHLQHLQARSRTPSISPACDGECQESGKCSQRRRRNHPSQPRRTGGARRLATATSAHAVTLADLEAARVVRDAALEPFGLTMDGDNVQITNVSPDVGLSAPFNSWFTLFGQFFDHGLDLVTKGGSGTVFVPLQPDDPLYVPGSPTNFMVLTRATVPPGADGVIGTADDVRPVNTTTPFVDQNQTYTSHPSHQVFLRAV